jgi:hypothetical protein
MLFFAPVLLLVCISIAAVAEESKKHGVKLSEWIKRLSSDDVGIRNNAASVMILFGEKAAPATEALTTLLADQNPDVRRHAVTALGGIGPKAKAATESGCTRRVAPSNCRSGLLSDETDRHPPTTAGGPGRGHGNHPTQTGRRVAGPREATNG